MIKYYVAFFVFCVILFLYLHINYHLKCSNDLEVYTIERPSKEKLEEICDLRQPVIFDFVNQRLLDNCNLNVLEENYGAFDVLIRDKTNNDYTSEIYLPFLLKEATELFVNDKDGRYICENNYNFLKETGVLNEFRHNDSFLRPSLVSNCFYDFVVGSVNSKTPLRYDLNYRNYYFVTSGVINIKLIPPHYTKYLYMMKDYDNFEFRSPVNVWDVQDDYKQDFDKLKVLDITLKQGEILYIPAYWWYSIHFEKMSTVLTFKYRTFMNTMAISPELIVAMLQGQNIKREVVTKMARNEPKKIEKKKEKTESKNLEQ